MRRLSVSNRRFVQKTGSLILLTRRHCLMPGSTRRFSWKVEISRNKRLCGELQRSVRRARLQPCRTEPPPVRAKGLCENSTYEPSRRGVFLRFPDKGRVPHVSLVFREMWDITDVDRSVHRMNQESEGRCSGIPHLAKNERDMGHPPFVWEPGHSRRQFSRTL